jgi:hypothetical protein
VPVQRDFWINDFSEKDGKPFRHKGEEEGSFSRWEKIFEERTLDTMAILMGYQKRQVLKVFKTLHSQNDGRRPFDFQGHSIGAEETHEQVHRGFRIKGKGQLASLESFFSQRNRILHLDQRPEQAIVSLSDLPDPFANLSKVKVIKSLPIGLKKFVMGLEIKTLIGRPGVVLLKLIQEFEKIEI